MSAATARVTAAAAGLLALAVAALALYLLIVGARGIITPVDAAAPPRAEYRPYPAAVLPLAAAVLVLVGLRSRRQRALAWAGLLVLFLFGGLFVFGKGPLFLGDAVLLLLLLAALQFLQPEQHEEVRQAPRA